MMILTIVSLCIAVGGIVLMSRGGVPESVSGLVYNLSERMRWAWSGWLIAVALTLMVPLMSALGDLAWLGWLTVVCLIGAAVTPVINAETRTMHHVCGIAAGVLSQVCVALTTAPELPAKTLTSNCYSYMFDGCSSLNYIKVKCTTKPSTTYSSNWLRGVAASGTFVKTGTWSVTRSASCVPTNWTVQTVSS